MRLAGGQESLVGLVDFGDSLIGLSFSDRHQDETLAANVHGRFIGFRSRVNTSSALP
jgi:hypothetical protein